MSEKFSQYFTDRYMNKKCRIKFNNIAMDIFLLIIAIGIFWLGFQTYYPVNVIEFIQDSPLKSELNSKSVPYEAKKSDWVITPKKEPSVLAFPNKVYAGDSITLRLHVNKKLDYPGEINIQLVDNYTLQSLSFVGDIPVGEQYRDIEVPIPTTAKPDMYYAIFIARYKVNSLGRYMVYTEYSTPFEVLAKKKN